MRVDVFEKCRPRLSIATIHHDGKKRVENKTEGQLQPALSVTSYGLVSSRGIPG